MSIGDLAVNHSFLHSAINDVFCVDSARCGYDSEIVQKKNVTTYQGLDFLSSIEDRFKISPKADMLRISVMGDKMNVTSPKILAQVVRNARKQRKLTQRETAESIGMKQSTVSEFENHPEGTCIGTLFKLLAALDLKLQAVSRRGEHKSSDSWDQEW